MSCELSRYDSWLHTRVKWQPVRFDIGEAVGKAAIFPFNRGRLPWVQGLTKLMCTVRGHELGIYKFDAIPELVP